MAISDDWLWPSYLFREDKVSTRGVPKPKNPVVGRECFGAGLWVSISVEWRARSLKEIERVNGSRSQSGNVLFYQVYQVSFLGGPYYTNLYYEQWWLAMVGVNNSHIVGQWMCIIFLLRRGEVNRKGCSTMQRWNFACFWTSLLFFSQIFGGFNQLNVSWLIHVFFDLRINK